VSAQLGPLKANEQLALSQLENTGHADLSGRPISADFLEDVIAGVYTNKMISAKGIAISNAVIQGTLDVTDTTVPFPLRFYSCTFEDGIDFEYETFAHDLTIANSKVGLSSGPKSQALFVGMKVAGLLRLDGTDFNSSVDFTNAEIGSELHSDDVGYDSSEVEDFDGLQVHASAFFRKDRFRGMLDLSNSQLSALQIEGDKPPGVDQWRSISINVDQAHIVHEFDIRNVVLENLAARFLEVQGPMNFRNVVPSKHVDLTRSHLQILTIEGFEPWLRKDGSTSYALEGLSFEGVEIPRESVEPPAMRILDLLNSDRCPYSPQPYLELEKFLRSHGNPEKADLTYIDMRRKERKLLPWWQKPFNLALDVLVGYGRLPWKAGIYALLMVSLGAVLFQKKRMLREDPNSTDTWFNPFWYSLDLLSPIDLGVSKKWRAKDGILRDYMQVHRIAGWILIPFFVAAITGIVK